VALGEEFPVPVGPEGLKVDLPGQFGGAYQASLLSPLVGAIFPKIIGIIFSKYILVAKEGSKLKVTLPRLQDSL
jgi:hypothetical protein